MVCEHLSSLLLTEILAYVTLWGDLGFLKENSWRNFHMSLPLCALDFVSSMWRLVTYCSELVYSFGAGRLFMRQPMARLALAAYWIFIHVWMAYFSLSATKYTKITHL